ncbi:acyl carrier protein [Rhizobiaceae sp. 2RAB30]
MPDTKAAQIRAFIVENFLFGDEDYALGDDLSLVENDIVDSTGILEMVSFLEERFGIAVADADIVPANLDSVARIAAFVAGKQAGERAAG